MHVAYVACSSVNPGGYSLRRLKRDGVHTTKLYDQRCMVVSDTERLPPLYNNSSHMHGSDYTSCYKYASATPGQSCCVSCIKPDPRRQRFWQRQAIACPVWLAMASSAPGPDPALVGALHHEHFAMLIYKGLTG